MQHSEETELVDSSALSSVSLAERGLAAPVAENTTFRLHSAVLVESLEQTGSCIFEGSVADHIFPLRVGTVQLPKMSENGTWYLDWLGATTSSFNAFSSLSNDPETPG